MGSEVALACDPAYRALRRRRLGPERLAAHLEAEGDIEVVGEAGDAAQGNAQRLAVRLDPKAGPVSVDEGHYRGCRRSRLRHEDTCCRFQYSLARLSSLFATRALSSWPARCW